MVVEVGGGWLFNSMALLADGWHMGTHLAALSITLIAYWYARKHASDPRFSFGTGKVGVLGGYTSALILGLVAVAMMFESVKRLFNPISIRFNEAIAVAAVGLAVNVVSAWLLRETHDHASHPDEADNAERHDHNLRAAYLHVLADAVTSVLAIVALTAGKFLGWVWMDAFMGIAGGILVGRWAWGLLRQTSEILLDSHHDSPLRDEIKRRLESDGQTEVADLHLWKLSSHHYAVIASVVTRTEESADHYKDLLADCRSLAHVTVEVNRCPDLTLSRESKNL